MILSQLRHRTIFNDHDYWGYMITEGCAQGHAMPKPLSANLIHSWNSYWNIFVFTFPQYFCVFSFLKYRPDSFNLILSYYSDTRIFDLLFKKTKNWLLLSLSKAIKSHFVIWNTKLPPICKWFNRSIASLYPFQMWIRITSLSYQVDQHKSRALKLNHLPEAATTLQNSTKRNWNQYKSPSFFIYLFSVESNKYSVR